MRFKFFGSDQSQLQASRNCGGFYLATFIQALTIPGFAELGAGMGAGGILAMEAAHGTLRSVSAGLSMDACTSTVDLSRTALRRIQNIVKSALKEQTAQDSNDNMRALQAKWDAFVPDNLVYNDSTKVALDNLINFVIDWQAQFEGRDDQIYLLNDFILTTGTGLRVYQELVREAALGAAASKGNGEALRVKQYAAKLSDYANHVHVILQRMAEQDVYGMARAMYRDNGGQVKNDRDHPVQVCYLPREDHTADVGGGGQKYVKEKISPFYSEDKLNYICQTDQGRGEFIATLKSTDDLAEWFQYLGDVCCDYYGSCQKPEGKIEPRLENYVKAIGTQLTRLMFTEDPAVSKYYNETIPNIIKVATAIRDAPDDVIYALADGSGKAGVSLPSSSGAAAGAAAAGGKPYCKNNNGHGFGSDFDCGGGLRCTKDDGTSYSDASICVPAK